MARITTVDALRRVIREPNPATRAKIKPALDEQAIAFVQSSPFALLSTFDADGAAEVSPKGDDPGFVRVEDPTTLLMPERAGNHLAMGLLNIVANGRVGLLFLRPRTGETLRVTGRAEIFDDEELVASLASAGKPAFLAIRIHVEKSFFHCARSVLRSKLWQPDGWPEAGRVSFGRVFASVTPGIDEAAVRQIDERIQGTYEHRLWSNG